MERYRAQVKYIHGEIIEELLGSYGEGGTWCYGEREGKNVQSQRMSLDKPNTP